MGKLTNNHAKRAMRPPVRQQGVRRKPAKNYDWNQHLPALKITLFWLKNLLLIAVLFMGISTALTWVLNPNTLPIKTVKIDGTIRTDNEQVEKQVSQHISGNFFTVNLQEIREAVKTLTWVKDVQVHRIWPDILSLKIQEHIVAARWQSENATEKAVDETGRLLEVPVKTLSSELPIFISAKKSVQKVLARYNILSPYIESLGLHIRQVVYNTQQTWTIILDNGMILHLGRDENTKGLQHFTAMYTQLKKGSSLQSALKGKNIIHIDLRYHNGMVIRVN